MNQAYMEMIDPESERYEHQKMATFAFFCQGVDDLFVGQNYLGLTEEQRESNVYENLIGLTQDHTYFELASYGQVIHEVAVDYLRQHSSVGYPGVFDYEISETLAPVMLLEMIFESDSEDLPPLKLWREKLTTLIWDWFSQPDFEGGTQAAYDRMLRHVLGDGVGPKPVMDRETK